MVIGNNREDQKSPMQQGASGIMGVSGPQAATGNAVKTPTKRRQTGTGFAGLQSYLTNNPNSATQATQQVASESADIGQQVSSGVGQVEGKIKGQTAVNRNSTYQDVDMAPVKNLEASAGKVQEKGQALAGGDYLKYREAQGMEPSSVMEGALYSGMMGASMGAPQLQAAQGVGAQNVATEALKGLTTAQDTQRTNFNTDVAKYESDYQAWQAEQDRLAQEAIKKLQDEEKARKEREAISAAGAAAAREANAKIAALSAGEEAGPQNGFLYDQLLKNPTQSLIINPTKKAIGAAEKGYQELKSWWND